MQQSQQKNPSPKFYKIIAVTFLLIGGWLIWQAVLRHEWFYWVLGILTVVNGLVSGLKSLVPRETRH